MNMNQSNLFSNYARNLNQDFLDGKTDPIIGREDEIRRLIEVLNRKNKNNPVLIGEPGVGKTAIVEGLAQRIVNNEVPDALKDKEVWELSLSSLIAGASYQGQFEERLNAIINTVKKSDGRIILFIDEIHQIVGMGKTQGSMDAANILKPMMARGEIKIIGATTLKEYRDNIEKDSALERRMSKVMVSEPTRQEALTIMRGLKEKWELFHSVKISDSALVSAVDLSDRYITDRFLPDKAIDLIDEACAKVQIENSSMPQELDTINREIIHLETEKVALEKEKNPKSENRLKELKEQLANLSVRQKELDSVWQVRKKESEKLTDIKQRIKNAKNNIEWYQLQGEYGKASELLYEIIPALEKEKVILEAEIKAKNSADSDLVTDKEVAEVISKATGIPLQKMAQTDKEKLLNLTNELHKSVKGQEQAIKIVSDAVLRGRVGINDPNRPIGSFLFLGPTGVGKTEVSKTLTNCLFDTTKNLIRLDMSEYMEKHSLSKLIGAPPGYVGYDQPGALTEGVRRRPYSVVLFDEIEKAHPDILNILLQILDEGQIKDSQGKLINFRNTIIILTSNIGSKEILENKKSLVMERLMTFLKPELINRIDEIVIFNPLTKEVINEISRKFFKELSERLAQTDYIIHFDDKIIEIASNRGFDEVYGARPLKRWIQKNIETQIAEEIIKEKILKNKIYSISFDDKNDKIIVNEK